MRAITYTRPGDPSVLELVERPIPEPGDRRGPDPRGRVGREPDRLEVAQRRVRRRARRSRRSRTTTAPESSTSSAPESTGFGVGDRVWVTLAGDGRPASGTAQEYTVVPAERVFPLPAAADFELGASIGIPAVTAHRALTVAEDGPARLHPGALGGRTVLVAGGAGAVGNAAIQLARWAGATVIATVSGDAKARLARLPARTTSSTTGTPTPPTRSASVAPDGVDLIVEVAAGANAELDQAVLRPRGTISIYANDGGVPFDLDVRRNMGLNARYQFVLLYTVGWDRIAAAAADINQAIEDGASASASEPGCRSTASASTTRRPRTAPSRAERSARC